MLLAAMFAVATIAVAPALAQDEPAVVADATAPKAKAGGAFAEAECKDGYIESKAGGVVAKAPCEEPPPPPPKAAPPPPPKAAPPPPPKAAPPPPPPAPKAAPAPPPPPAPAPPPPPAPKAEEKKELPKSGGSGVASLFALGGGALLVAGGLLVRRMVR